MYPDKCISCANWLDPSMLPNKDLWWRLEGFLGHCLYHRNWCDGTPRNTGAAWHCISHTPLWDFYKPISIKEIPYEKIN